MPPTATCDALVVGGGVIGLSIAEQLADAGLQVTLLDRGQPGREASWAGAGVLPPASWYIDHPVLDEWSQAASVEHERLSQRLRAYTGIDDQYHRCGATYLPTPENTARLARTFERWRRLGVSVNQPSGPSDAWRVPDEAQVRNPRRLQALQSACVRQGVAIAAGVEVRAIDADGPRIRMVETSNGAYAAGVYCFAAGCWTGQITASLGLEPPIRPVRGQMLLLRAPGVLDTLVHRHPYYAVPRRDGLVLVGATVEDVGFDKRTTSAAQAELRAAATAIDPRLGDAPIEGFWSGLRPATEDGLPLVGRAPGMENVWIAAGHHRSGLLLAPPTAEVIAAGVLERPTPLTTDAFDPCRFATNAAA